MTSTRRVASAFAVLALLAFNLGCPFGPSDPVPETDLCTGAPREAEIDGIAPTAEFVRGGQGSMMVTVAIEWIGAGAPECANADIRFQRIDGTTIASRAESFTTEATARGRRTTTGLFFIVEEDLCEARVEVDSYGRSERVILRNTSSFLCVEEDAGTEDGADAGP